MNYFASKLFVLVPTALLAAGGAQLQAQTAGEFSACAETAPDEFVTWARDHSTALTSVEWNEKLGDLLPLRNIVGDARVVGLGESARRVHEFYAIRARIFRFLVEDMGFTALAMETGFAEASNVNDYLLGRIEEPKRWQDWFTFGFGDETELQTLLRWMRRYNLDSRHTRKLHFYGVDSMVVYSSPETAIGKALEYLDRVDQHFTQSRLREDLVALTGELRGSGLSRKDMEISLRKYVRLPEERRNLLTARIADLLARLEAYRLDYIAASSDEAYRWGYRFAIAAKQLDTLYREVAGR